MRRYAIALLVSIVTFGVGTLYCAWDEHQVRKDREARFLEIDEQAKARFLEIDRQAEAEKARIDETSKRVTESLAILQARYDNEMISVRRQNDEYVDTTSADLDNTCKIRREVVRRLRICAAVDSQWEATLRRNERELEQYEHTVAEIKKRLSLFSTDGTLLPSKELQRRQNEADHLMKSLRRQTITLSRQ